MHKLLNSAKTYITLLIALLAVFSSCRKNDEFSSWDTKMLTPVANTTLTLNQLVKDSSLHPNADSSLMLAFNKNLYSAHAGDFFHIPDTEVKATLTLERLKLADKTLTQPITLLQVYPQAAIAHGQTIIVDAQDLSNVGSSPIDGSTFFQTAVLNEGYIDITIQNGFPIDIKQVDFVLVNKVTGNTLVTGQLTDILSGQSKTKTDTLSGKRVDATMEVKITRLQTYKTPSPVLINKNDKVDITVTVRGLKPKSATAVFPSQSVYSKDENALYNFNGAEIKQMRIKSGVLRLRIVSTIEENMTVNYSIPHARLNGNSVNEVLKVAAAPKGKNTDVVKDIPLAGYTIDLRGRNPVVDDTVNAFWNLLDVTIDSSGIQRSISLKDSVYIYYGLLNMVPEYAVGYFGQQELKADPGIAPFDLFKNTTGTISLEDMDMNLVINNGIGADAQMDIKSLKSINNRTGTNVTLTATPLGSPIIMPRATDNPFTEQKKIIKLDKTNSNIKAFVQNLPDEIEYRLNVLTNPLGNTSNWKDFIYDKSELRADLEVSMPLSMVANNLTLSDTIPFEMFGTGGQLDRVKEGTFNLILDNSFPLSAGIQAYLVDEKGTVIDSLVAPPYNIIQAAVVNSAAKVVAPVRSVLKFYFTRDRMEKLRTAKRMVVKATFNTPTGNTTPVKIYSHYKFDIKLTGDFVYEQRF